MSDDTHNLLLDYAYKYSYCWYMWIHVCCYSLNTQYARRMLHVSAWNLTIDRFGWNFFSSRFCRVLCKLEFLSCPHISWFCGLDNLPIFANCSCILVLNCEIGLEPGPTYLSWSNMFFYNCYPYNQILYLCSMKMQSFSLNHQVYSKITKMKT